MGNSPDGKHRLVHVLKFILENCDEEFPAFSATDIQAELSAEEININADRRAIYTDIAAIREVLGLDIEGTSSGKFRRKTRPFQYDDLCLIAECIYAAKFISDGFLWGKSKDYVPAVISRGIHGPFTGNHSAASRIRKQPARLSAGCI